MKHNRQTAQTSSSTAKRYTRIISVFCVFILVTGAVFLYIRHKNGVELPGISQQTETDGESSQGEQQHAETPKKRPYLTRRDARQYIITKEQTLPSSVNPLQLTTNTPTQFVPIGDFADAEIVFAVLMSQYSQGKITFEYLVDFLESQHIYEPAILEKLEPRRAFRYLVRTLAPNDVIKAYAKRILTEDADNPDARAHMVNYERDDAKAAALYREILTKHPEHPPTLAGLGYCLLDSKPEEAIHYLKKANRIEHTFGLVTLARAYERLGDVKTAWFCYEKNGTIRKRESERFPLPKRCVDFFVYGMNWRAIEAGKYWSSTDQQEREIREFINFRDWVRNIVNRKPMNRRNDFLAGEIERHLKGGKPMFEPERIIRAYEITTRYPGKAGIQRPQENRS